VLDWTKQLRGKGTLDFLSTRPAVGCGEPSIAIWRDEFIAKQSSRFKAKSGTAALSKMQPHRVSRFADGESNDWSNTTAPGGFQIALPDAD
jgi:hypothetical protein